MCDHRLGLLYELGLLAKMEQQRKQNRYSEHQYTTKLKT